MNDSFSIFLSSFLFEVEGFPRKPVFLRAWSLPEHPSPAIRQNPRFLDIDRNISSLSDGASRNGCNQLFVACSWTQLRKTIVRYNAVLFPQ